MTLSESDITQGRRLIEYSLRIVRVGIVHHQQFKTHLHNERKGFQDLRYPVLWHH